MRGVWALAAGAIGLSAVLAFADPPGPGQPFDDDDAGCVPDTTAHRKCSETLGKAFARLTAGVTSCHDRQARMAFSGSLYGEEACEAQAQQRLETTIAAVAPLCSPAQLALAAQEETDLLDSTNPRSLDAQNGDAYCDATSGAPLDPTGDDAGWVPATVDTLWCERGVAKNLAKLAQAALKCHAKMAYSFYTGRQFDEEACEEFDPLTHRGARDRYSLGVAKLMARGGCPPCLDGVQQEALALRTVAQMDSDNGRLYPCP